MREERYAMTAGSLELHVAVETGEAAGRQVVRTAWSVWRKGRKRPVLCQAGEWPAAGRVGRPRERRWDVVSTALMSVSNLPEWAEEYGRLTIVGSDGGWDEVGDCLTRGVPPERVSRKKRRHRVAAKWLGRVGAAWRYERRATNRSAEAVSRMAAGLEPWGEVLPAAVDRGRWYVPAVGTN